MIPIIGIMIGGYIVLRAVEIFCRNEASFSSPGARTAVLVLSVLVIGATVLEVIALMQAGDSIPRLP